MDLVVFLAAVGLGVLQAWDRRENPRPVVVMGTDEKKHPPCQGTRRIKVPFEGGFILHPCSCAGKDTMIVMTPKPKEGADGNA